MAVISTGTDTSRQFNMQDVVHLLNGLKVKSYATARLILEMGKAAVKHAMEVSPIIDSTMKTVLQNLDRHAQSIGNDATANPYPAWDDLRHWVIQACIEYNAALEGAHADDNYDFWKASSDFLTLTKKKTESAIQQFGDAAKQGMNVLEGVFIVGGLVAVTMLLRSWAQGKKVHPNVHVGLLPAPHISVGASETPSE